ncbi:B-cell lymphoma 3 protein isoform X1 [Pleurodeles waltl]|uniref:B-cell lymphoma 3 protein isoform X1 n=1 Tax=Pleurodeles waltl TaxID=8319 RepID=UPI0037096D09
MILDACLRDAPAACRGRWSPGPAAMEQDPSSENVSPLDLRTKRSQDTPGPAGDSQCQRSGHQLGTPPGDGTITGRCHLRARPPEVRDTAPLGTPAHLPWPHGLHPALLYHGHPEPPAFHHQPQGVIQRVGVLDPHPLMAPSVTGRDGAQPPVGIPEERPEIWRSQQRSVCPVPPATGSPRPGDRPGFQSPQTVSPLEGLSDGATPTQEPAGTLRALGGGEEEATSVPRSLGKAQNSLPLRKRRYAVQACEGTPLPATKVPKEQAGALGVKEEPGAAESASQHPQQPLSFTNGCAHPDLGCSYLDECPRPAAYYPGPHRSYPPHHLPLYPLASHALGQGAMLGIHPSPYQLICPLENQLNSDIALASKQDEDGDTALHIAVAQGNFPAIQRLVHLFLQGQKNLDTFNNLRQTPLHLAVITKQPEVAQLLVRHRASPMALDRNGQTSIHLACEHGSLQCLQALISQSQEALDLETRNYEGFTPLHVAVETSDSDLVLFLLHQGADIDAVDIKSGRSPLTHAVDNNSMDMVSLLIRNGANVNSQTYSGNTALHSASGRGLLDIVRVLVKNGADSSIKNYHNDTSLMVASNKKVTDILRGKASRPLPHQCSTPKAAAEIVKEMPSPGSSCTSSPSRQLVCNDSLCQSPATVHRSSLMTSHQVLPASPPQTLRSMSNYSCEPKISQRKGTSLPQASHRPDGISDGVRTLGLGCDQFCSGQSDVLRPIVTYPMPYSPHPVKLEDGLTHFAPCTPQTVKLESGLYTSTAIASDVSLLALGHMRTHKETSRVLAPLRNGLMDPTFPARCSPNSTSTMFMCSEYLTSHGKAVTSIVCPSPSVFQHVAGSPTKINNSDQTAAVRSTGQDLPQVQTFTGTTSPPLPHRTGDSGQDEHSKDMGQKAV